MDVISIIAETLQIVYTYVPQEVVILLLTGLVMGLFLNREDKTSAEQNNKKIKSFKVKKKAQKRNIYKKKICHKVQGHKRLF